MAGNKLLVQCSKPTRDERAWIARNHAATIMISPIVVQPFQVRTDRMDLMMIIIATKEVTSFVICVGRVKVQ